MSEDGIEWRRIEQEAELKSFIIERWGDGTWANVVPEADLRKVKKVNVIAFVVIIILWIVGMMIA